MMVIHLLAAWTLVLAGVTLVLWRDARILEARIGSGGSTLANAIEIGAPAPRVARGVSGHVVFLTDACEACREVAVDLDRAGVGPDLTIVLGSTGGDRDAMLRALPRGARVVDGPGATAWERAFDVRVAPFAIRVEGGIVAGKGFLRGAADLATLAGRVVSTNGASEGEAALTGAAPAEADRP